MAGGCEGFVDCDVDAGEFGAGETGEVLEVQGGVDDGDVHGDVYGVGFTGAGGGGDERGGVG